MATSQRKRMITVQVGYFGSVHITGTGGRYGVFYPERRTITGRRDKFGQVRAHTASEIRRLFKIPRGGMEPGEPIVIEGDKGIFDPIRPEDIWGARFAYSIVSVPLRTLSQFARLATAKAGRKS